MRRRPPRRSARRASARWNGAPSAGSAESLPRISRQRCACSRSSLTSSACGEPGPSARCSSFATTAMVDERRAELVRGGGREPVELREMLLAREHQLGRGERVRHQAALLGDLPRIGADEHDRHQVRDPDRQDVERRQHQLLVDGPRQRPELERDQRSSRRPRTRRAAACSAAAARSRRSAPARGSGTRTDSRCRRSASSAR